MRRKIIGDLIQEIIERMMELSMVQKEDHAYSVGRIQGLRDALDILTNYLHER